ncbi:COG4705 family protein [Agrobacterium arsenijevicii]|uniref:Membrane protein n=1 Tax=Agrobacterium arsenijevicii TaxID=1585697 RepID=A0ABR5DBZ3_9HYPH|nr:membrane protein [Agrobacterium arsenijevicii]
MSAPTTKAAVYNRVPSVTTDFWLIKLMAVTMGETAADYLNVQMGLGLTATSLIMSAVLVAALIWQFAQKKYVPASYWLSVVLISIVGTLITDNLVDNFHVPLLDTTIAFSIALALTFLLWSQTERTLSIHSIFTGRREAFYWLAILFTFALGTAAGDLVAEKFALGYLAAGVLFGMVIISLSLGYFFLGLDPILGFWLVYILTRPLGASFGDLMSQPAQYGGLGLGTIITSAIFLAAIVAIVAFMSVRHEGEELAEIDEDGKLAKASRGERFTVVEEEL